MDEGLLNDLLECSVCLERLDTSSRVLPCQHTFCLKCLKIKYPMISPIENVITHKDGTVEGPQKPSTSCCLSKGDRKLVCEILSMVPTALSRLHIRHCKFLYQERQQHASFDTDHLSRVIVESHKELRCPECRVLVETKVEELPPNVLLMRILEGMRNSAPRKLIATQRPRSGHSLSQQGQQSTRDGKQLPPHARAMYDYISKEPGDLSFKKGETILLQKKLDTFWYQGECSGRTGMFPITFVQVVVPLPIPTALCKAMYDFRMTAPDEEGCLAFDKGAIITVHRRVDENWAEGRLEQRVGIFPIAFVEFNQPANQIIYGTPLNRPVPPIPDMARPGHSEHRHHAQHPHRYQQISMSTPATAQNKYQNVATMSQSHPNCHAPMLAPQQILVPQTVTVTHGLITTSAVPRNIVEPQTKHSIDLIHFNKAQGTMGLQSVSRIGENYDRIRAVKYENHNSTPVHKVETTYQNVRTQEHFPVSNFSANNLSSDSSSSMNTPSVGVSSSTPNTSSNSSSCESNEPSMPSSPDNNTERNATVISATNETEDTDHRDQELNTSMGVMSLNESSTATNTSLNVSLPPSESPKLNASSSTQSQDNDTDVRLDAPSSSKTVLRSSGPDSLLTFGLGLQAALSPSHGKDGNYMLSRAHREHHHRDKRHSLTPSSHLQGNHTQNRHSAEIVATSLLDAAERRRRRSRSSERGVGHTPHASHTGLTPNPTPATSLSQQPPPLPAPYLALYPYRPQKPDELELKKGGIYTVTERCRDGWFKGCSERSQRFGVFPGNYVAPAGNIRSKSDKSAAWSPPGGAATGVPPTSSPAPLSSSPAMPTAAPPCAALNAPTAPPRARTPPPNAQPLTYPWNTQSQQQQQSTPRSEKPSKEKTKPERSTISTGVNLMKRLAAMKKCKSPPAVGYSIDNPVFEDTTLAHDRRHAVHVRSGSCPSQLLRALPGTERARHKERPAAHAAVHVHELAHSRQSTEGPWQSQHRKSQSLDVTASRKDRHHSQPVKERFRCIVPYPPNSEYELELKVDDIVIVSKKRGDGWYKGTLQRTGRTGLFPASFVQSCPHE